VHGGEFQVVNEPLSVYLFVVKCDDDFGSSVGLQKVKGFIQRIGFVIACGVDLIADGFSCRDITRSPI